MNAKVGMSGRSPTNQLHLLEAKIASISVLDAKSNPLDPSWPDLQIDEQPISFLGDASQRSHQFSVKSSNANGQVWRLRFFAGTDFEQMIQAKVIYTKIDPDTGRVDNGQGDGYDLDVQNRERLYAIGLNGTSYTEKRAIQRALGCSNRLTDRDWITSGKAALLFVQSHLGVSGPAAEFERSLLLHCMAMAYSKVLGSISMACRVGIATLSSQALVEMRERIFVFQAQYFYPQPLAEEASEQWEAFQSQHRLLEKDADCRIHLSAAGDVIQNRMLMERHSDPGLAEPAVLPKSPSSLGWPQITVAVALGLAGFLIWSNPDATQLGLSQLAEWSQTQWDVIKTTKVD